MQKIVLTYGLFLSLILGIQSQSAQADDLWYPYKISTLKNDKIKQAKLIFNNLLRATTSYTKRKKPKLFIVYTRQGPWSASMPDGSILLSESAINHAFKGNRRSAKNKLAYVIAHELALFQAKEFWHRQYFSIAGATEQVVEELQVESILNLDDFVETSSVERTANRKALMMMATMGYDYIEIAKNRQYFNSWLNANWEQACKDLKKKSDKACSTPKKFTQNRHAKFLKVVADQVIYDTALQAYIAGDYRLALSYLEVYLRKFSHPKAHLLVGLSHLTSALDTRDKFVSLNGYHKNIYIYPLMYDSDSIVKQLYQPIMGLDSKTGNEYNIGKQALDHKTELNRSIDLAVKSFEKAIKLDSMYKIAYLNLVAANLTLNDLTKANKFLFSKYVNRFGGDSASNLYSGVLHASFRRSQKAKIEFSRLTRDKNFLLATLGFVNLAEVYRSEQKPEHAQQVWKKLKEFSNKITEPVVKAISNPIEYRVDKPEFSVNSRLTVAKIVSGEKVSKKLLAGKSVFRFSVDIPGKKLTFYHTADGARVLLNAEGYVHAVWQDRKRTRSNKYRWLGKTTKSLFKKLGAPDKVVPTLKGRMLVYSELSVAFSIVAGKIEQWFYFPKGV